MTHPLRPLQFLKTHVRAVTKTKHALRLLAFVGFLVFAVLLPAQAPFVTTWKTDYPGTKDSNQIQIPGTGINYDIFWEEVGNPGNNGSALGNNWTKVTFPSPGTYSVSITPGAGTFTKISFLFQGDRKKILEINQWGDIVWSDMSEAFRGCHNLECHAVDIPDLSNVFSLYAMFGHCETLNGPANIGEWDTQNVTYMVDMFGGANTFNQDIGNWNTENVTDMSGMFLRATSFNQDISNWNTENVTNMEAMFSDASSFNQEISNWNTENVIDMSDMFSGASSFNQDIGSWNTENVTDMSGMFRNASMFNQNISSWNTDKVTFMSSMFSGASSFNQDISHWNIQKVAQMSGMFSGASSFNQDIGNWNIQNVISMHLMFSNAIAFNQNLGNWKLRPFVNLKNLLDSSGMDCSNYSATLMGWSDNPSPPENRIMGALGLEYGNDVVELRNHLINNKGWTITGDTLIDEDCLMPSSIHDTDGVGTIRLWPNPAIDQLYLDLPQESLLNVFDLTGRQHLEMTIAPGVTTLPLHHLTPGMYIFHFEKGERHLVVVQ